MECPSALIFVWVCCWNRSYMSWKPWKRTLSQLYIIEMNICPTRRIAEVDRGAVTLIFLFRRFYAIFRKIQDVKNEIIKINIGTRAVRGWIAEKRSCSNKLVRRLPITEPCVACTKLYWQRRSESVPVYSAALNEESTTKMCRYPCSWILRKGLE